MSIRPRFPRLFTVTFSAITLVIVSLALIFTPTTRAVGEDVTFTLTASPAQVSEGGTFTLTVNVAYGTGAPYGIGSWTVDIPYDSSKFLIGSCSPIVSGSLCNTSHGGGSVIRISGSQVGDIAQQQTAFKGASLGQIAVTAKTGSSGATALFVPTVAANDITDSDGTVLSVGTVAVSVSVRDTVAPTITQISSSASGYKRVGDSVPITITFSEPVTSTASASLSLNSGGTATCPAVTATSTMSCLYTVGANQTANPLNYSSTGSDRKSTRLNLQSH